MIVFYMVTLSMMKEYITNKAIQRRNDMQNQFIWQERFNIGVDVIDKEHKKLFQIINRLFTFYHQESKSQWVCQESIKYFKDHAMKHFIEEEAYMASIDYSGFETHRQLHDDFRKKTLPALERELEQTGYSANAVEHFLGVCTGWLIGHTLTEDRAITGKTMSKYENLLPEEESSAMKKIITNLLRDMFQLKAHVISKHYGGERFGNGFYYRLIYTSPKKEEWEIILAFEEKLLINTIGKMINDESSSLNVMIVNATRYTARQFVERIKVHYPALNAYELKSENLLTYEQLQQVFRVKNPPYSLLFDTGAGYFAFCTDAPDLKSIESGSAIKAENAMEEIKNYLKETEEKPAKKILIVDDSDVMRTAVKELLIDSYQISEAPSGFSAIRSIILNRPDLILLDYEMPVCNGLQVLEMIRAETDMADIPVMFLTGKATKESLEKILALKPAGYLLKSLKPEEIKKCIQDFFRKQSKK